MLQFIIVAIVVYLVWLEVLPIKRWYYEACARMIGTYIRSSIAALELFEKIDTT